MNTSDLSVILSIIVLEGLLSVDNALVNASLASSLPRGEQKKAIRFGIGAGAILRLVALLFASLIIRFPVVKIIGAGYLVYLMVKHLCFASNGKGHGVAKTNLKSVIGSIALADIAFSLDNVVAAVGMSPKITVVVIGVMAGIVTMIFATQLVVIIMRRYPMLEKTAYAIVGFVGMSIFSEEIIHFNIGESARFTCIICAVLATACVEETRIFTQKKYQTGEYRVRNNVALSQ